MGLCSDPTPKLLSTPLLPATLLFQSVATDIGSETRQRKAKTDRRQTSHSLLLFGKLWRDLSWPFIFHLRTVIMGSRVACKEPRRLTTNPLTTKNKKCLVIWLYSKQVPPIRLHIFFTLYLKLISSMKPPQVSRNPTLYNMSSWIIA